MTRLILALLLISFTTGALAQTTTAPRPLLGARPALKLPIDPLGLNDKASGSSGDIGRDLLRALDDKLLPDLKMAQARAEKSGSNLTKACWDQWIAIIEARQAASTDKDGQPVVLPDPHVITTFEDLVELRNALQPDSKFMTACAPLANMVRTDIFKFLGMVIGGGAGLGMLVPGL